MAKTPFTRIKVEAPGHNRFDLSHDNKLTFDMGKLIPVLTQETIPGDNFRITPEVFIRLQPLLYPIMHRIDVTVHYFYVPYRILWQRWEDFYKQKDFHPPYFQGISGTPNQLFPVSSGDLHDYFGLPISADIKEKISAFPFLAYYKIFNEYYQDQNNDSEYEADKALLEKFYEMNGRIAPSDFSPGLVDYDEIPGFTRAGMLRRAWEHDYFTSCLPTAQAGQAVNIPLTISDLPVTVSLAEDYDGEFVTGSLSADAGIIKAGTEPTVFTGSADVDEATYEGTITQLRTAMALTGFLEKNMRSGQRYNEQLNALWDENIGDARINRPEYLGGIKNNVVISEVLQTSQSTEDSALGDYSGHATGIIGGNTISFHAPENGLIMGIMSVMPKTAYMQGIPRKFQRFDLLDFPFPDFAHIGEQAVLNKELYYNSALTDNNDTFGYIERFGEMKYNPSEAHADMRTSLLSFSLVRTFDARPALNADFIYCHPSKRIFAVEDENTDSLYAHIYHNMQVSRKIPFYTEPASIV